MTAQDFYQYLEEPRLLYELPLTELQQLALRFPYSPNLRLLLLLKTKLDKHPGEKAYLERCAAASFDRGFLYDILQELDRPEADTPLAEATDTLELRELDELHLPYSDQQATTPLISRSVAPDPLPFSEEEEEEEEELLLGATPTHDDSSEGKPVTPAPTLAPLDWVDKATSYHEILLTPVPSEGHLNASSGTSKPVSPAQFQQLKRSMSPSLKQRLGRIRKNQENKATDSSEEVNKIARRSLVAHEAVASETLAQLLVQQGQYQHAIKMYRRLILLYPDKKPIFAGLIKELKEKL